MKKSILTLFVIIVFAATTSVSFAQTQSTSLAASGSIYSSIGVGYPIDVTSASQLSQGILGVSNINGETSGIANPALWAQTYFTQAGTGLSFSNYNIQTNTSSGTNNEIQPGYLHILFPVKPGKAGISLGLYPVTRSNFTALNEYDLEVGNDTYSYTNEINSTGGINKLEFGFGYQVNKNIAIGYAPSLAFINSTISESLDFSVSGFTDQYQSYHLKGSTFAQRFGITGTFTSLLHEEDRFSFGLTYNLPYTISTTQDFTALKAVEGAEEEVDLSEDLNASEGDIELPQELAFGVGYAPRNYVSFSAEMQTQSWSQSSNELYPEYNDYMSDRFKIGLGGQYQPYRRGFNTFLSSFKYSAGLSYDSGHLTIQDEDISTLWLNAGIGIPSKTRVSSRTASFIDISLQYGLRGTTSNNLYQENIWSLGLSINLSELMFVRPKLR